MEASRWLVKIFDKETGGNHQCEFFHTKKAAALFMYGAKLHAREDIELVDLKKRPVAQKIEGAI